MIQAIDVSKCFGKRKAIDRVNLTITPGHVFGLIGTNGAGKSTFMRMLCGALKPNNGEILMDGEKVYDNPEVKKNIFFIADDQYFFRSGTPKDMLSFYKTYYENFDEKKFYDLLKKFGLEEQDKINTFSKGMKKQLAIICGICANTTYLFCDETFDGLDPVMRQAVKSLFAREIEERKLTPVIASHNLRELEDICEYVGLLHKGGILLEKDIDDMKLNIHKMQCVIKNKEVLKEIEEKLLVLTKENRGSLYTYTIRGSREKIDAVMDGCNPLFYELLPLSLEEIFISETEVMGYDIKTLIL